MDNISNRDSFYVTKPGEDGGEKGMPPGHLDRSSMRRLSVTRTAEECDEDGHIRRGGKFCSSRPSRPYQSCQFGAFLPVTKYFLHFYLRRLLKEALRPG